jgi:hypothetical protein
MHGRRMLACKRPFIKKPVAQPPGFWDVEHNERIDHHVNHHITLFFYLRHFMKTIGQSLLFLFAASSFSSCLQCVECTNCTDSDNNVEEICYDEARPYYRNRQEWRQDVKSYETLNGCQCQ